MSFANFKLFRITKTSAIFKFGEKNNLPTASSYDNTFIISYHNTNTSLIFEKIGTNF